MTVEQMIREKRLPELLRGNGGEPIRTAEEWALRRKEILELLCREVYGRRPAPPISLQAEITEEKPRDYAGKALHQTITLTAETENGPFSFPVQLFLPLAAEKLPMMVVYISFLPQAPNNYLPVEEIIDSGIGVVSFCYNDIAADKEDHFSEGLAGVLHIPAEREPEESGKIMLWSWAASRVMDYLLTRSDIDHRNIAMMGHSRLGKTALLTAACDERFAFAFANDSGCSGDSITRGKKGERVAEITHKFPFWFCPNYCKYAGREEEMPFDQHFLIAAIAPRFVCAGAAVQDEWADPTAQYLSYCAASEVYALLGKNGFIHPDRLPEPGDVFHEGSIGFHLREGEHFHSRYDWQRYLEFMKKHRV